MGLRHYESFFMEFRMYWIVNHSLDPAFNLALEEYFLGRIEPGHPGYAILWQNSPAIVVGRFQNTRQEVNADFVRERGISVVRRMTGGGSVYHDAGTLNYTFIHHLDKEGALPAFSEAGKPIAEALQKLGLPVTFSGRNDLMMYCLRRSMWTRPSTSQRAWPLSAAAWGIWLSIWPCTLRICRR